MIAGPGVPGDAWTARRGLVAVAAPLAFLLALAAAGIPDLPLCATLAGFGLVVAIAHAGLEGFHPANRFGAANAVTLARAAGAALLGGVALAGGPPPGATVATPAGMVGAAYLLAGFSAALLALDGIDGWLARRAGLASRFGARFDMEVDALTALVLSALAWQMGKAGPWVLGIGLARYAFVLAGAVWPRLAAPPPPSNRRKAVCVLQLGTLTLVLLPGVTPPVSAALAAFALAALAWSFARDIRRLARG